MITRQEWLESEIKDIYRMSDDDTLSVVYVKALLEVSCEVMETPVEEEDEPAAIKEVTRKLRQTKSQREQRSLEKGIDL